jgi:hypothetical protein
MKYLIDSNQKTYNEEGQIRQPASANVARRDG